MTQKEKRSIALIVLGLIIILTLFGLHHNSESQRELRRQEQYKKLITSYSPSNMGRTCLDEEKSKAYWKLKSLRENSKNLSSEEISKEKEYILEGMKTECKSLLPQIENIYDHRN